MEWFFVLHSNKKFHKEGELVFTKSEEEEGSYVHPLWQCLYTPIIQFADLTDISVQPYITPYQNLLFCFLTSPHDYSDLFTTLYHIFQCH